MAIVTVYPQKNALTEKIEGDKKQMIIGRTTKKKSLLVEGDFISYHLGKHIFLHGGSSTELINSTVLSLTKPSLIFTVLLEGRLNFGYDDINFSLSANNSNCTAFNCLKPANFRREIVSGNKVKKINIVLSAEWVAEHSAHSCEISQFLLTHKSYCQFQYSDNIQSIAQQIMTIKAPDDLLKKLHYEHSINTLIYHLFEQLNQSQSMKENTDNHHENYEDAADIIHYIETHLDENMTLESLASKMNMSVSNLQRKFKQQLNLTVLGYIRFRRLELAKQHLDNGIMSITEAAYNAGYHHPSNFTNAFKKTFGSSPSDYLELKKSGD